MKRVKAVADADAMRGIAIFGEFTFEGRDFGAADIMAGFEHASDRAVNFAPELAVAGLKIEKSDAHPARRFFAAATKSG